MPRIILLATVSEAWLSQRASPGVGVETYLAPRSLKLHLIIAAAVEVLVLGFTLLPMIS